MFHLDVQTIIFGNFLYSAVISFFLVLMVYWKKNSLPGLSWWASGYFLICINFLILSLASLFPPWFYYTVPHLLTILGYLFVKEGLARFFTKRRLWGLDLALFIISFYLISETFVKDLHLKIILSTVTSLAALLLTLFMLRKVQSRRMFHLLYLLAVTSQLIRLILGMNIPPGAEVTEAGTILASISMLDFFTLLIIAMALVFISLDRLIKDQDFILERLKNLSLKDELTGLLNRRGFKEHYENEEKRARRNQSSLTLAICDIDDFKNFNDQFGHQCGDKVLKMLAYTMEHKLREIDILARWGGEEFIILLPETNRKDAEISLERLRLAVEEMEVPFQDLLLRITLSIGCFTSREGILHVDHFLKQADKNLYEAKTLGKNRVVGTDS